MGWAGITLQQSVRWCEQQRQNSVHAIYQRRGDNCPEFLRLRAFRQNSSSLVLREKRSRICNSCSTHGNAVTVPLYSYTGCLV